MSSSPTGTTSSGIIEPAIDDLHLDEMDDIIELNYDAPEPGSSFPPRLKPGIYDFKFELEDDPFGRTSWQKEGKDFFEVRHKAIITRTNGDGSKEDVPIRFIRAANFLNEKMEKAGMNSGVGELLRSLNIHLEKPIRAAAVKDALRAADGRAYGRLILGWRVSFPSGMVYSTHPRLKKGETKWPLDDNKLYVLQVTDPSSGAKAYGRENVINYQFLPGNSSKPKDDVQFT